MRREHLNTIIQAAQILEREPRADLRVVTRGDLGRLSDGSRLSVTSSRALADAIRNFSQGYVLDDS